MFIENLTFNDFRRTISFKFGTSVLIGIFNSVEYCLHYISSEERTTSSESVLKKNWKRFPIKEYDELSSTEEPTLLPNLITLYNL